jgi:parvulin-like peptidyl-prolyl isomerase
VVDHILIGVENPKAPPGEFSGKRAAPAAKKLAYELFEKLKAGSDWAAAKKEYSEDGEPGQPGGPYGMANYGVKPATGERARTGMVPAFGNVGFKLAVGEIGIADYDTKNSPFGFHIIKRTK